MFDTLLMVVPWSLTAKYCSTCIYLFLCCRAANTGNFHWPNWSITSARFWV